MTLVIETKQFKPQRFRVDEIRLELLNELRKQGTAIKNEYEKTTQTWKRKPKFERLISTTGGEFSVIIGTDNKIYRFVDLGTKVRHAVMSRDWISKTSPNIIGSGPGRGRKLYVSKAIRLPGLEPRNFSKIIQERRKRPFHRAMVAAMKRGAAKANARGQA